VCKSGQANKGKREDGTHDGFSSFDTRIVDKWIENKIFLFNHLMILQQLSQEADFVMFYTIP
jgi:hypothetical protein